MSSVKDRIKYLEDKQKIKDSEIRDLFEDVKSIYSEIRTFRRWILKAQRLLLMAGLAVQEERMSRVPLLGAVGAAIPFKGMKIAEEKLATEAIKELEEKLKLTTDKTIKKELEVTLKELSTGEAITLRRERWYEKITGKFSLAQIMFITALIFQIVNMALDKYDKIKEIERQLILDKDRRYLREEIYDRVSQMDKNNVEEYGATVPT